jgi:hypothetical protein
MADLAALIRSNGRIHQELDRMFTVFVGEVDGKHDVGMVASLVVEVGISSSMQPFG